MCRPAVSDSTSVLVRTCDPLWPSHSGARFTSTAELAHSADVESVCRPLSRETRAVYETMLTLLQQEMGDKSVAALHTALHRASIRIRACDDRISRQPNRTVALTSFFLMLSFLSAVVFRPHDVLASCADEVISVLKDSSINVKAQQASIESLFGHALSSDRFRQLVNIGMKITDFKSEQEIGGGDDKMDTGSSAAAAAAKEGELDELGVSVVFGVDEEGEEEGADGDDHRRTHKEAVEEGDGGQGRRKTIESFSLVLFCSLVCPVARAFARSSSVTDVVTRSHSRRSCWCCCELFVGEVSPSGTRQRRSLPAGVPVAMPRRVYS